MKTQSIIRILRNGAVLAVVAAGLAACGGGGGGGSTAVVIPPPPPPAPQEDFFGTAFGVDFRAAANTDPVTPKAGDIIAVSYTTDPQAVVFPTGS